MADKTTGKLKLWLAKITDKISDTIVTYLPENFTKIDTEFSSLKDEVTSHKAENASKHIKESGSNTNGSYIRFDDGAQICTLKESSTETLAVGASRLFTWTYPAGFNSSPQLIATPLIDSGSATNITGTRVGTGMPQNASCNVAIKNIEGATAIYRVSLLAIGRWKA